MSLSSREWEDLKSLLDKAVHKFLGFTEQSLVTAALNCIDKGYDKKKTISKFEELNCRTICIKPIVLDNACHEFCVKKIDFHNLRF